jgi:hypothetical protein
MDALYRPTPLIPLNPMYMVNDKYYIFKYKPSLDKSEFDKQNPILFNRQLYDTHEKIFTWILGKNRSGEYVFCARESKDILELFSKHISIFLDVSCQHFSSDHCIVEVEYAGEMLVHDKEGEFNLLSGTFMKDKTITPTKIVDITQLLTKLTGITFIEAENTTMITKEPDIKYIYDLNILDIYEFDTKEEAELYNGINERMTFVKQGIRLATRKGKDEEVKELSEQMSQLEKIASKKPLQIGGNSKKYFIKS